MYFISYLSRRVLVRAILVEDYVAVWLVGYDGVGLLFGAGSLLATT